ncbi:MAG: FtsW/RodA/SpoVE family cell cycle protein [Turicibacter sp.]|nr:FtsW/RodA/SpoVE family cell cycle protein [Turicibacter sp.]
MKNFLSRHRILLYNPMLVYLFILVGIGLIGIHSAYPNAVLQYPNASTFVFRQLLNFSVGLVAMGGVLIVGIDRIRVLNWYLYGILMVLLVGLVFHQRGFPIVPFSHAAGGAARWYQFPGFTMQPAEFMRFILIMMVGDIIQKHNYSHPHARRTSKTDAMLILKSVAVIIAPTVLIYLQPDSGTAIFILLTTAVMLLVGGVQWRYILTVALGLGLVLGTFLYIAYYYPQFLIDVVGIEAYRVGRFNGWFDPFGTFSGDGNQLARGLVLIGSGGMFGNGMQAAVWFVQEAHTDYIFSTLASDFGFMGAMAILIVYGLFMFEIINTAVLNRGHFNSFVCSGIFASLIAQLFWNMGMNVGLLPISGVTLPFVSYGGSSMLATMIMLGLVLSSYVEGAKIKHTDSNYRERILYLKTKAYLKDEK